MRRWLLLRGVILSVAALSLAGCATVQPLRTPTGKPEVAIPNVTKKEVIDALTNAMLANGYSVKNVTDYSAVYGIRSNSILAGMLFGSQYDSVPEMRVSYAIVDSDDGVRVITALEVITNPGSAFERVMDVSKSNTAQSWQSMLEQLKASLAK